MDPIRSDNVGIGRLLWLFFGLKGRVSRAAYLLAALLMVVILTFTLYRIGMAPEESDVQQAWLSAFFVAALVSEWSSIALAVKRLHDFDKTGMLAIVMLVPALSIVAFVVLCIVPGTEGANSYGERTNAPG